jgi:hypothetical protein
LHSGQTHEGILGETDSLVADLWGWESLPAGSASEAYVSDLELEWLTLQIPYRGALVN